MLDILKVIFLKPEKATNDAQSREVRSAVAVHKQAIMRFTEAAVSLVNENDRLKAQSVNRKRN